MNLNDYIFEYGLDNVNKYELKKIKNLIKNCALDVIIINMSLFCAILTLDAINHSPINSYERNILCTIFIASITMPYIYTCIKYYKFLFANNDINKDE